MTIDIPGAGTFDLQHLVFDFNGTIARDGLLLSNLDRTLVELADTFAIHVITADTSGTAGQALAGLPCSVKLLEGDRTTEMKEQYVRELGADQVVAIGNGANDRLMLKAARLGIAVLEGEGGAASAILHADIVTRSIYDALGLLMIPQRIVATLRT
jgi:soluble P-type ATPase